MKREDIRIALDNIYAQNEVSTYLNDLLVDIDEYMDLQHFKSKQLIDSNIDLITDHKAVVDIYKDKIASLEENRLAQFDLLTNQKNKIEELTKKLIKSNKDYCPEKIGYEVGYKYIHEHCDGLNCDQCTADHIAKGSDNV
jgi:hypothetical protein